MNIIKTNWTYDVIDEKTTYSIYFSGNQFCVSVISLNIDNIKIYNNHYWFTQSFIIENKLVGIYGSKFIARQEIENTILKIARLNYGLFS